MVSERRSPSQSRRSSRFVPPSSLLLAPRVEADRKACAAQHANVPVEFEKFNVSGGTSEDAALFKRSMDSLRRNKVGLKGASASKLGLHTPR
jgi:hypothetical protein